MKNTSKKALRAQREWKDRHAAFLEAATHLLMQHGYSGSTMQMIADRAGFSVGYLYKHFGGKQDLLDEILNGHLRRYDAIRSEIRSETESSPLDRYRREIQAAAEHLGQYPGLLQVLLQPHSDLPPWLHAEFRRQTLEDIELIREAQAQGELPAGDPALLAATLSGAVRALFLALTDPGREAEVERLPEYVEQYVLQPMAHSTLPATGKETQNS